MPIIATAGGDGHRTFAPAPLGVHSAVCCDVRDLGLLETTWQGETRTKHKILLSWQIAEDRDDGKPWLCSKRYTLSLHEKSALRKDLESWRGRPFTEAELAGFDVETIIGVPCLLNITHRSVGDATYANVVGVTPLMKGLVPMRVREYVRWIDRAPTDTVHDEQPPIDITDSDIPF